MKIKIKSGKKRLDLKKKKVKFNYLEKKGNYVIDHFTQFRKAKKSLEFNKNSFSVKTYVF